MKKLNHLHRYRKVKMGKARSYVVYACQEPDCKHYIAPELLVGKIASCFTCRAGFRISREQVRPGRRYLKLNCPSCSGRKKGVDANQVDAFLSHLGFSPED